MTLFLISISAIFLFAHGYFDRKISGHIINETERAYLNERCKGQFNFGLLFLAPNSALTDRGILYKRLARLPITLFAVIIILGSMFTFIYNIE